ncbi:MAG: hypothetical protein GF350_12970 [Chitinivibrionales bacterium]|nr:hypothetical protein [Chitinivibrionales bacterium]
MPFRDGTGPQGLGPGTGRGRGWCRGFFFPGGRFSIRRTGIFSALVPVAGAVIRDAMNPHGLLRAAGKKLIGRSSRTANKEINAKYTVVGERDK